MLPWRVGLTNNNTQQFSCIEILLSAIYTFSGAHYTFTSHSHYMFIKFCRTNYCHLLKQIFSIETQCSCGFCQVKKFDPLSDPMTDMMRNRKISVKTTNQVFFTNICFIYTMLVNHYRVRWMVCWIQLLWVVSDKS